MALYTEILPNVFFGAPSTTSTSTASIKHERRQISTAHICKTLDFKPKQCRRINSTSMKENMEFFIAPLKIIAFSIAV